MGLEHNHRLRQLETFLQTEAGRRRRPSETWTTLNVLTKCPQQKNSYDCGVYLCTFAELLSKDQRLTGMDTQSCADLRQPIESQLRRYVKVKTTHKLSPRIRLKKLSPTEVDEDNPALPLHKVYKHEATTSTEFETGLVNNPTKRDDMPDDEIDQITYLEKNNGKTGGFQSRSGPLVR